MISLQPAYFLALILVVAADVFDNSSRRRGLARDSLAGTTTLVIALVLNYQLAEVVGAVVALVAITRLLQKIRKME
jgi:hypothetical protein